MRRAFPGILVVVAVAMMLPMAADLAGYRWFFRIDFGDREFVTTGVGISSTHVEGASYLEWIVEKEVDRVWAAAAANQSREDGVPYVEIVPETVTQRIEWPVYPEAIDFDTLFNSEKFTFGPISCQQFKGQFAGWWTWSYRSDWQTEITHPLWPVPVLMLVAAGLLWWRGRRAIARDE